MEYRNLAQSDLKLSVITFGAWAIGGGMWGKANRKDAIAAIQASYQLGVTSIDTAPIYGAGASEEIVAEAIQDYPRDKVQILTKYGMRWNLTKGDFVGRSTDDQGEPIDIYKYAGKESIMQECEDSLRRLRTDYIDLYQVHWPESVTPASEIFEAVERLIEQGKVRYAGVCNYDVRQFAATNQVLPLVSNQIPFSMVNRGTDAETIPYCLNNNKAVLVYSPLERGLLTGKMTAGYPFAKGDHRKHDKFFTDESILRTNLFLERLKPLADEKGATLSQLVLRWTVDHPGITIALAGARNSEQAALNAAAADIHLSIGDIEFINSQVDALASL